MMDWQGLLKAYDPPTSTIPSPEELMKMQDRFQENVNSLPSQFASCL